MDEEDDAANMVDQIRATRNMIMERRQLMSEIINLGFPQDTNTPLRFTALTAVNSVLHFIAPRGWLPARFNGNHISLLWELTVRDDLHPDFYSAVVMHTAIIDSTLERAPRSVASYVAASRHDVAVLVARLQKAIQMPAPD